MKVWTLNDNDYFTTAKQHIFYEHTDALTIVSIESDEYDEEEFEEDFNNFTALYDLEMTNINNNILIFSKIEL